MLSLKDHLTAQVLLSWTSWGGGGGGGGGGSAVFKQQILFNEKKTKIPDISYISKILLNRYIVTKIEKEDISR